MTQMETEKLDPQELEKLFHLCEKAYAFLHLPISFKIFT